jgi:hypothetical protein
LSKTGSRRLAGVGEARLADEFEDELAALRREVGSFVLEVLGSGTDRRVVDEISAGIAERLNRSVTLQVTLGEADRRAIGALQDQLAAMRTALAKGQLGYVTDGRANEPQISASGRGEVIIQRAPTGGRSSSRDRRGDYSPVENWIGRYWHWVAGGAVIVAAGVAAVLLFGGVHGFSLHRNNTVASDSADAGPPGSEAQRPQTPADAAEAGWATVRTSAQGVTGEAGAKALKALCGDHPADQCPTFAQRRAELAKQPAQRQEAMLATLAAMARRDGCPLPASGAAAHGSPAPTGASAPPADLTEAMWNCMVIEAAASG